MLITLRLIHVVGGILWVGGMALLTFFVFPALNAAGAAGGAVMQQLAQRTKMTQYLPIVAGLTVLSGFWLYYHDVSISGGAFAQSRMGMTLGIGGAAGLAGLIVGMSMGQRSAKEMGKIGAAVGAAGGQPTAEQSARMAVLASRIKTGSAISMALLFIAIIAMAVARYL
jgi:hypothetical protein